MGGEGVNELRSSAALQLSPLPRRLRLGQQRGGVEEAARLHARSVRIHRAQRLQRAPRELRQRRLRRQPVEPREGTLVHHHVLEQRLELVDGRALLVGEVAPLRLKLTPAAAHRPHLDLEAQQAQAEEEREAAVCASRTGFWCG